MTNIERLKLEIKGIDLTQEELNIYLQENSLTPEEEYNPASNTNKKNILKTALSILESIANNPQNMKNYKIDDMTITQFTENLNLRIDNLSRKIRLIANDDDIYTDGANFTYMFTK